MDELSVGWEHFRAARLIEAHRIARDLAEGESAVPGAWHLLGSIALRQNRPGEAEACLRKALDARPDSPGVLGDLGVALSLGGRLDEAVETFGRALKLAPELAEVRSNLAISLSRLGRNGEAAAHLREAARLRPGHLATRLQLGQALLGLGRPADAEEAFRTALATDPASADAHLGLGVALSTQRKPQDALAATREAARLRPGDPLPHLILGGLLRDLGRPEEALAACDAALRLRPDDAEAHHRRGNALDDLGRFPEAIAAFGQALLLNADHPDALNNMGSALGKHGRIEEAFSCFDRLLERRPDEYSTHLNRALLSLAIGDFSKGFSGFEWRWKVPGNSPRPRPRPAWQGEPLAGRTILLHTELGFGDSIQFIRYAPVLKAAGARVLVECGRPLLRLFGSCAGIDGLFTREEPPADFDVHAPLMSLPRLVGTTLETVPAPISYLAADPESAARWEILLGQRAGLKIGIAWQGSPGHPRDRVRSFPLAHFRPLADLEGVRLIRLQKGHGVEQLRDWKGRSPVEDPEAVSPGDWDDFQDTAAIMANLDLVISADSSPAHLAGALGVPVWIVLPFTAEWRWLIGREDSPWYPSARLFRQAEPGNWDALFERVTVEVAGLLEARGRGNERPGRR